MTIESTSSLLAPRYSSLRDLLSRREQIFERTEPIKLKGHSIRAIDADDQNIAVVTRRGEVHLLDHDLEPENGWQKPLQLSNEGSRLRTVKFATIDSEPKIITADIRGRIYVIGKNGEFITISTDWRSIASIDTIHWNDQVNFVVCSDDQPGFGIIGLDAIGHRHATDYERVRYACTNNGVIYAVTMEGDMLVMTSPRSTPQAIPLTIGSLGRIQAITELNAKNPEFIILCAKYPAALIDSGGKILGHLPKEVDIIYSNATIHSNSEDHPEIAMGGRDGCIYVSNLRGGRLHIPAPIYKLDSRIWGLATVKQNDIEYLIAGTECGNLYKLKKLESEEVNRNVKDFDSQSTKTHDAACAYIRDLMQSEDLSLQAHAVDVLWSLDETTMLPMKESTVSDLLSIPSNAVQSRIPELIDRILKYDSQQLPTLFKLLEPPVRNSIGNALFNYGLSKIEYIQDKNPELSAPLMDALTSYRRKLDSPADAIGLLAAVEHDMLEKVGVNRENVQLAFEKLQKLKSQKYDIVWTEAIDYIWWLWFDEQDDTIIANVFGNGIWRFNYRTGERSELTINYDQPTAVRRGAIFIDNRTGNLTIGTNTGVVECYTRGNERITHVELGTGTIECLTRVGDYFVIGWAGTGIEVYRINGDSIQKDAVARDEIGHPTRIIPSPSSEIGRFVVLYDHGWVYCYEISSGGKLRSVWKNDLGYDFGISFSQIVYLGDQIFAVAFDGRVFVKNESPNSEWERCGAINSEAFLISEQLLNDTWWLILGTRDGDITAVNGKRDSREVFPRLPHGMSNGVFVGKDGEEWVITAEGGQLRGYRLVDEQYLEEFEEMIQKLVYGEIDSRRLTRNIFAIGTPPPNDQAKHRTDDLIDKICAKISGDQVSVFQHVSGPSGSGKSTLLHDVSQKLRKQGWATAYINLAKVPEKSHNLNLTKWIITELGRVLPRGVSGLTGNLERASSKGIRDFIINANAMGKRCKWRGLVLMIDGPESLSEKMEAEYKNVVLPTIVDAIRHCNEGRLITAALNTNEIWSDNIADIIELKNLNQDESQRFLDFLDQAGLFVSSNFKERLALMAGGSLRVLQHLGDEAVNLAREQQINIFVPTMMRKLETSLCRRLDHHFQNLWNNVSPWGQLILGAICHRMVGADIKHTWVISLFNLLKYFLTIDVWREAIRELETKNLIVADYHERIPVIKRLECGIFAIWINQYVNFYHVFYSNLNLLSKPVPINALLNTDRELRRNGTLEQFMEAIRIPPDRWSTIIKLCDGWISCAENNRDELVSEIANDFLIRFNTFTGSEVIREVRRGKRFLYLMIRLTGTTNSVVRIIPLLLVLGDRPISRQDCTDLRNIVHNLREVDQTSQPVIILVPHGIDYSCQSLVADTGLYSVVIDDLKFQQLLFSENPAKKIAQIVISSGNIKLLDPYQVLGAVRDKSMFFGREIEVTELTEGFGLFIVIGSRKIGKSTVLVQSEKELKRRSTPVLNLDCISVNNLDEFIDLVNREIQLSADFGGGDYSIGSLTDLERFLRNGTNVPITLFLDEFDELLSWDFSNRNILSRWLHQLASRRELRVAIAGWDTLYRQCSSGKQPLFNAGKRWELRPLSNSASNKLIQHPFANLFIEFENEAAIFQRVYHQTGGYPALIQCIGSLLVERLSQTRRVCLRLDDVDYVLKSEKLQTELEQTFFASITGLARLVVISILEHGPQHIDAIRNSVVKKSRMDITIFEIDDAIKLLSCQGAIKPAGDNVYEISNPLLSNCLSKKSTLNSFEKQTIKEVKKRQILV